ncbi:sensor domain-containing diguanylate cyclase [Pseudohoeflea suaedae]|uniref:Sensor domain-containing diguanylate cyclase n=1 Tax=Pseudohoeflea suaedae TaxID=877384 RepID=A0A4R5PHB0_9HYPH|nr:diguanylate cyclase [Pseudohoeflea suaedae]TDH34278.1 sensor domain-containing diguanylate cyclase [Pseudohoeflea suaedae]
MKLNIFPSSMEARYAIAGSAIGALTSLVCLSVGLTSGHPIYGYFNSLADSPLVNCAALSFALGFGYVAARAGRRLDESERLLAAERAGVVELYHLAYHDALTGLSNRHALRRDTTTLAGTGDADETLAAVILIDLDRFKEINDTLGHDAGDEVLRTLARRLKSACDLESRAYRLGGDELVVLAEGARGEEELEAYVQVLSKKLFRPISHAGNMIETSGSIGISFLQGSDDTLAAALKRADLALYRAKAGGFARHAIHKGELDDGLALLSCAEQALEQALAEDRFTVSYQPVVETSTLKPSGFAASVRWIGDWSSVSQIAGFEFALDEWLIQTVLRDIDHWPDHLTVTLSLSPKSIRKSGFAGEFADRITRVGQRPERFILEVDLRHLGHEPDSRAKENLMALRAIGVSIATADLVAGRFDIPRAANSPADHWRIDAGRLRHAAAARSDRDMAEAVNLFADAMGLKVRLENLHDAEDFSFAAHFPGACVVETSHRPGMSAAQAGLHAARFESDPRHLRKVVG